MKPLVAAVLLFVATSARGDHVWRMWCGDPPGTTKGVYDTSRECWEHAHSDTTRECVDTKDGPTYGGKRDLEWEQMGIRTCAEARRYDSSCVCRPESVPAE
jgi:hypothetical protein